MDTVEQPEKWQAGSHPDLAARKPTELFEAEFAPRYDRMHNELWGRMTHLHGTIQTLEKLAEFPFNVLYAPQGMEFWRLVVRNFLDMACLMLHSLVRDKGRHVLSLPAFRDRIMRAPWRDRHLPNLLAATLRERSFDDEIESIAKRVEQIRHSRIAHRLIDEHSGSLKGELAGVSLDELRQLFDASHGQFGALCFGSHYITLAGDLIPSTVGGKPTRTCLDEVLDAVLRDSYFVNEPEREQPWWPDIRKHTAPEELKIMNDLRKRIGLPEA